MGGAERAYVKEAFDTNWIAPLGANVNGFEADICRYNDIANCAVLNTGTAALHLSLILLGVDVGDEVLCSSFTFSATCNAIRYQKAIPVFVDSELDSWNMCPDLLQKAIEDRIRLGKKPKACLTVHLYGMPSKIDQIKSICDNFDIPLIEDAAEALGATFKGQKMGTFGVLGIYSFNGNKIITTSGGGALVSIDKALIDKARFLSTQARDESPHYQHSEIGYNYRMSNICAGIGRGQMEVLDQWITKRRNINKWYRNMLAPYSFIEFLEEPNTDYFSNFWLTTILVKENSHGVTREKIRLALKDEKIESRPLWKPMHMQPVFKAFPHYLNGVSESLFEHGLCLPSGSNLTEDQRKRIQVSLLNLLENKI